VPWQFFATALTESSASLVSAARIISKVYFPRLVVPLSAICSGLIDALIATLVLLVLMAVLRRQLSREAAVAANLFFSRRCSRPSRRESGLAR
jgi:ABC-type polysaccharide/polyol phosphate export permease